MSSEPTATSTTSAASSSPASSSSKTVKKVDICVVGAGVSGLAAINEIQKQLAKTRSKEKLSILCLEANSRVGGRCFCDEEGCDLGGAYFGPTQDRVCNLAEELGLKMKKVNTEQKTVAFINNKTTPFDGVIPPLSLFALLDVNAAMVEMDRLAETVNIERPHLTPNAHELDNTTVSEMMNKMLWTDSARKMVGTAIRAIIFKEPSEVSVLAWIWYVAQSGNIKRICETKDGAQDSNIIGGAGQIPKLLALKVTQRYSNEKENEEEENPAPCELLLSHPVRKITTSENEKVIIETESNNLCVEAKYLILAIPPNQQSRISFHPPLPPIRQQALQNATMGSAIKCFLYYEKPFWREKNLNGGVVADDGITLACFESVQGTAESPKYAIMAFILSSEAVKQSLNTKEQRRDALAKHLVMLFDSKLALSPSGYKEHIWAEEPYIIGGPVAMPSPGALTKWSGEWMKSQLESSSSSSSSSAERVFIAGTETARKFVGYLDGAVESGERSGRNVLVKLGILEKKNFQKISRPAPSKLMPFVELGLSDAEKKWVPTVGQFLFGVALVVVALGLGFGLGFGLK